MSRAKSLRAGDTADKRKILSTSSATAAPTSSDAGWATDGADWVHIYAKFPAGVTQVNVTPWVWSEVAEDWFAGDPIIFNANNKSSLTENRGHGDRLYVQVTSISGVGTVEIWASRSYDGRTL